MNRLLFLKHLLAGGLASLMPNPTSSTKGYFLDGDEIYCAYVKGLDHYNGKSKVEKMQTGEALEMRREPKNKFDRQAIALYYDNVKLGYVPAEDNFMLSQLLDAGHGRFEAKIADIAPQGPSWEKICFKILSFKHQ